VNEVGKIKCITGQRKSLRRGSMKDEKDEKKEYTDGEGVWGERKEEKYRSETNMKRNT
jgi:hypothetical protein